MTRTIPELLDDAVEAAPDKTWLLHEDETWSYEQTHDCVLRAAAGLAAHGVGRGDLVLATARSRPAFVFTWLGVVRLGAIHLPCDPRASPAELAGLARQARPALVVTDPELPGDAVAALEEAAPGRLVGVDELFAQTHGDAPPVPPLSDGDPAMLIPTSGTTGRSKLVTQSHRAFVMAAEGFPWWLELDEADRLMTSLPLFHVNAPTYSLLGSMAAGASVILLPRFSASDFIAAARRHGATEFNAIGAMLEILMRQPERPDDAESPLRLCYTGPSPPEERQLEIEERFGFRITCGYAMSETTFGMVWPRGQRPYGTLGVPRQHPTLGEVNEARVIEDGEPVATGEIGELELRNPAVMLGYWGMPEETSEVISRDGWLKTGDLVQVNEDGTYTFIGRRKEVIRRRGENVAPAEIEEALESHPDVAEAAVVGVPSELSEEEIKAFVVAGEVTAADLGAIRAHAAERLTRFKVPRYMEALAELPHTPTGRIAKHRLPRERTDREIDFEAVTA